jgi:ADP-ribose pyrophosphatase YjhB (NUDIX family)
MDFQEGFRLFIENGKNLHPGVSTDCVIFGFHDNLLKVLLLKFKNTSFYALPGGFIEKDENLEDAVRRVLERRTGLKDIYLEQFYAFGDKKRAYPDIHRIVSESNSVVFNPDNWIAGRFISIGYYALVDFVHVKPTPDVFSDSCDWHDIRELPDLVFDHREVVDKALESLRQMLDYKLSAFNLLPESFTMIELQALYETILGKKLVRTNFQRKMLGLGILERLEKKWSGGAHKAPYLYKFNKNKYLKEPD